jgi:hypothetical protein
MKDINNLILEENNIITNNSGVHYLSQKMGIQENNKKQCFLEENNTKKNSFPLNQIKLRTKSLFLNDEHNQLQINPKAI